MAISYNEIRDVLRFVSSGARGEYQAYVCRQTGQTYRVPHDGYLQEGPQVIDGHFYKQVPQKFTPHGDCNRLKESGEPGETYHVYFGWDLSELPDDVADSTRYVEVPYFAELGLGNDLVREFALARLSSEQAAEAWETLRHRDAYRAALRLLQSWGKIDEWHKFEEEATKITLLRWCQAEGIQVDDS